MNSFIHIRNVTICSIIHSLQPWGLWLLICCCKDLPPTYDSFFIHSWSCTNGLLWASVSKKTPINQSIRTPQLVGSWRYTACHGQYSDLQENKRFVGYNQGYQASKSQSHTLQVRWFDVLGTMQDKVDLHVCTQPVTASLSFRIYYTWCVLQEKISFLGEQRFC